MRTTVETSRGVIPRRSLLRLVPPVAVVLLLTLSLFAVLGPNTSLASASPTNPGRSTPLSVAEQSLALGQGPAGGNPMDCSAVGGAASCSSSSGPHPATNGVGWGDLTFRQSKAPIPRSYGRSMAYDPLDHYVVLFGGFTDSGYISDTWKFAAGTWTELFPAVAPSDRDHSTLVWDPVDNYLLLFGGSGNGGQYGDTWSFVSGNWTSHSESVAPSGRWSASMTYDASDGYVVLFGGCNSGSEQSDTWKYLSGVWTKLTPNPHPASRGDAGMTYDPIDGYVVLFGGYDQGSSWGYYNDTWTFHAGNWTELSPSISPSARTSPAFAYDPWLDGVVLFGGQGATGGLLADTWLYANGTWTPILASSSPLAREFGIMANDPADGYLLLFGGAGNSGNLNDTWVLYTMNASTNASTVRGTTPLTVAFHATSSDPFPVTSYRWDFGDLGTGSGPFVNHTYTQSGAFVATVTATDGNFVQGTASVEITAAQGLSLIAVASTSSGVAPLAVTWAASAIGGTAPYTWGWTMDGTLFSTTANASYDFTSPGNFSVFATVTDWAHTMVTHSFLITVTSPVVAPVTVTAQASTLSGEAPISVTFTGSAQGGSGGYTGSWSFGDGMSANGLSATHLFIASGTFPVTFTAVDSHGSSNQTTLVVTVLPAVAVTATAPSVRGASPFSVTFTATPSGGIAPYYYLWNFGDGATGAGAVTTHQYVGVGTFAASVEVVDSIGHNASSALSVTVAAGTSTGGPVVGANSASSADLTAVEVAAELAVGAIAVAGLVLLIRRRG
jgi:PKD repeat protein